MYILWIHISTTYGVTLHFHQDTESCKQDITYHNVTALGKKLGDQICNIFLSFPTPAGSNLTRAFFRRSKIQTNFKTGKSYSINFFERRPVWHPSNYRFRTAHYLWFPKKRKETCRQSVHSESLTMKVLRTNLISHDWINSLDGNYHQLDLVIYDWK